MQRKYPEISPQQVCDFYRQGYSFSWLIARYGRTKKYYAKILEANNIPVRNHADATRISRSYREESRKKALQGIPEFIAIKKENDGNFSCFLTDNLSEFCAGHGFNPTTAQHCCNGEYLPENDWYFQRLGKQFSVLEGSRVVTTHCIVCDGLVQRRRTHQEFILLNKDPKNLLRAIGINYCSAGCELTAKNWVTFPLNDKGELPSKSRQNADGSYYKYRTAGATCINHFFYKTSLNSAKEFADILRINDEYQAENEINLREIQRLQKQLKALKAENKKLISQLSMQSVDIEKTELIEQVAELKEENYELRLTSANLFRANQTLRNLNGVGSTSNAGASKSSGTTRAMFQ